MSTAIYALVVIYQKRAEQSPACESLKNARQRNVVLIDNSGETAENRKYCQELEWIYLSMPGNAGLSRAYNAAIDLVKDKADYVVFVNDDTAMSKDYFGALSYAVCSRPEVRVWVPRVRGRSGQLSPFCMKGYFVHRLEPESETDPERLYGILAGTAAKTDLFGQYRFDERYFLDYIDCSFFRDIHQNGMETAVLETELLQRFTGTAHRCYRDERDRFRSLRQDCWVYCRDSFLGVISYPVIVIRHYFRILSRLRQNRKAAGRSRPGEDTL